MIHSALQNGTLPIISFRFKVFQIYGINNHLNYDFVLFALLCVMY